MSASARRCEGARHGEESGTVTSGTLRRSSSSSMRCCCLISSCSRMLWYTLACSSTRSSSFGSNALLMRSCSGDVRCMKLSQEGAVWAARERPSRNLESSFAGGIRQFLGRFSPRRHAGAPYAEVVTCDVRCCCNKKSRVPASGGIQHAGSGKAFTD